MTAPPAGFRVIAETDRSGTLPADRAARLELLAFVAIVVVAAALRLVDLPTRGTWDADQGHDMLVLRDLVRHGTIPLLGPPTSIGDFHHGMLYYVLLAPAAFASNADPTVVTAWIALAGIAAVAVTGWLARSIAGPVAGLVAALLMAVSASAVDESTFIWNPNLIALTSSIALAAAWQAWRTGRAGWWVVSGAACVATMHCHVLGVILTPVVASLLVADLRRRRAAEDPAAGGVGRAAVIWLALLLCSYIPLAIHEATSNASEIRAAIAFLAGSGGPAGVALPIRLPVVGLRVLGWPLVGLITDAPVATVLAAALVIGIAAWRGWRPTRRKGPEPSSRGATTPSRAGEAVAVRWLSLGLLWTAVALAVAASSLATVVVGLPNDHYHAFADPIVFVLVGAGTAALLRPRPERVGGVTPTSIGRPMRMPVRSASQAVGIAIVVTLIGWNLLHEPPAVAPDGGYPAAQVAAARVLVASGGAPVTLASLPSIKPADALRFPLEEIDPKIVVAGPAAGGGTTDTTARVVLCDELFHETIGAQCGGAAEDAWLAAASGGRVSPSSLVDRFEAAPGRWISVYRPAVKP